MPPAAPDPALRALLVGTKVAALVKGAPGVVTLRPDASVEAALRTLAGHKVLSAPVVQEDGEILGFLDVRDVVMSLLQLLPEETVTSRLLLKRMKGLELAGPPFAARAVSELPVFGGDGSFLPAASAPRMTLLELVNDYFLFPKETHATKGGRETRPVVHRAALHTGGTALEAVVSQSDVARFLTGHEGQLGRFGAATVQEMGWASRGAIVSVTPETSALAALGTMRDAAISGVAVVDAAGKLVGNFSVADLRALTPEHFGALALPVAEFLALEHGTEYWGLDHSHPDAAPAAGASAFARSAARRRATLGGDVGQDIVCAAATDTVAAALARLVARRLHRLYVVDGNRKPVGVVTLTDVLRGAVEAAK